MKHRRALVLWLVVGLLVLALSAIESWAVYRLITSKAPGANDFYSRWAGARAFFVEGRDPYGLDVTAEIQAAKGIDPDLTGKGSFAFPFHVVFLFWPLAYLPYAWAQAIDGGRFWLYIDNDWSAGYPYDYYDYYPEYVQVEWERVGEV